LNYLACSLEEIHQLSLLLKRTVCCDTVLYSLLTHVWRLNSDAQTTASVPWLLQDFGDTMKEDWQISAIDWQLQSRQDTL